ncbi:MAG: UDP-N-acetylmuramoyl-tripeptide--D-alanyl-D-alanine ligase [Polyangiaceae bacterium]
MSAPIPTNRATFTVDAIERATGVQAEGRVRKAQCVGVTTDSRGDVEGKLFVALSGERFDGHEYVNDVLARGAFGAIVQRRVESARDGLVFVVPSPLRALAALARAHRESWGGRVVTIGGSAGKTTTRSAVQGLLSVLRPGRVHGTSGNLNNLIGVPLTLLAVEPHHEIAVVEVGTNQRGEVEQLSATARADVAVLTCIGMEHSEGLGDLDGIEAEERALFQHMQPTSTVVGLAEDPRVRRSLAAAGASRRLTYGTGTEAAYRITGRRVLDHERTLVTISTPNGIGSVDVVTRLCGLPGALATAAAVCVADALDVSLDEDHLRTALDRPIGEAGRLRVIERSDRALIIDDCYNANPISMRSSFQVAQELARANGRRLRFVLGEMRELGAHSSKEHAALAEDLPSTVEVFAVGAEMVPFVERARALGHAVSHFADANAAAAAVVPKVGPTDAVLIKGSRGVRLERLVSALTDAAPMEGEGHAP